MPPKRGKVQKTGVTCHPDREDCDKQILNARLKFLNHGDIYNFVPNTLKNNLFKLCIIEEIKPGDKSPVVTDTLDYSSNFTLEREREVMKHSFLYMATLYCLSLRDLPNRLLLVDRMLWGDLLGIPFALVRKWWPLCREVEIQCQLECPTILGYIEPNMIFTKGRVPTEEEKHLRLKNRYMENLLERRDRAEPFHNFKPKCLSRDDAIKSQSARLAKQLESEMFDGALPAGGRYRGYCPVLGFPVSQYIEVTMNGVKVFYWQQMLSECVAERKRHHFDMSSAEVKIFCDCTPAQPKTNLSDRSATQGKEDTQSLNARHGLKHVAEQSKFAQPHADRLTKRQRAADTEGIDVDALIRHAELMDCQMKRGRDNGSMGGVDLDFRLEHEEGESSGRKRT